MENQTQKTPVVPTPMSAQGGKSEAGTPKATAGAQNQADKPRVAGTSKQTNDVFIRKIVDKIKSSENILVALSRDPSVDEMAAAIGLTLFLDSIQKHTTAIYSGVTPDALQFLQPEGTFETNTDSLQDFIIALNKEKADHLRYKLDGDFVKVYITPYKSNITEEDLEFSHGDFNVNLVLAIGVPSAADLDSALSEHGRIMHDATTVDITTDVPGKFAEIEWSNPGASSVSEMVTQLIFAMQGEDAVLDKETATALLTGIVAATGRFSNDRTNSDTMQLASKLMAMGADQQLISAHVVDNDAGLYSQGASSEPRTDLTVTHDEVVDNGPAITMEGAVVTPVVNTADSVSAGIGQGEQPGVVDQAELAAAASAAVNEAVATAAQQEAVVGAAQQEVAPAAMQQVATQQGMVNPLPSAMGERKDYAQMIEQALAEGPNVNPQAQSVNSQMVNMNPETASVNPETASVNPAAQMAPTEVASGPEPVAKPAGVTLPPPPAPVPTADMMPPALPTTPAGAMQGAGNDATSNTPTAVTDSSAFHIPGVN